MAVTDYNLWDSKPAHGLVLLGGKETKYEPVSPCASGADSGCASPPEILACFQGVSVGVGELGARMGDLLQKHFVVQSRSSVAPAGVRGLPPGRYAWGSRASLSCMDSLCRSRPRWLNPLSRTPGTY
eukprot:362265-Chlamydomonas_euryale.AAC.8